MAYQPSQVITDVYAALKQMINILNRPMWVDPTTSDVKVKLTSGTVTTVTTVTTAGTLTNLGTANVTGIYIDRNNWASSVRPNIV